MEGPVMEHSDSDSGESWTLLENNSIYADEAPELIEEQEMHGVQQNEKDEDTDGISIISDSDHEMPPPLPSPSDEPTCSSYQVQKNLLSEKHISEYGSVDPLLPKNNDDNCEPSVSEDFLGDSHAKHKTYVHRRNKRLSTVLNIIVLGSVITAAGVAIGHMWGAKNDCAMQTTSSVNKILSKLYKLQEENAYLRNKLKELTSYNRQQKIPLKHNKCRKVFEESLNNNEPRKFTKCVDEKNYYSDHLIEHLVKPKYEKEFIGDIDKLKTVYLQNKSWLDDEISRRLKIEEELVKKYNNEVNAGKDHMKAHIAEKDETQLKYSDSEVIKKELSDNPVDLENPGTYMLLQKKVTYADSLKTEHKQSLMSNKERPVNEYDSNWLNSKHNVNTFEHNDQLKQKQTNVNPKSHSHQAEHLTSDNSNHLGSVQTDNNINKEQHSLDVDWIEVKPKFRRNEERYETDYDTSFLELKHKATQDIKKPGDNGTKEKFKLPYEKTSTVDDNSDWIKNMQYAKNIRKKERRETRNSSKQNSHHRKGDSENGIIENVLSEEDFLKDNRYVVNKVKQDKKRNVHNNKKQKRKIKVENFNMKGEYGDKFEAFVTPEDYVLNYPDEISNFDELSLYNNIDVGEKGSGRSKNSKDMSDKFTGKDENLDYKINNKVQGVDWFEKRAVFRTQARKKYYEQLGESSSNNSSWYFRRMRKREQCRGKGDNSTSRKIFKENKTRKVKQ